MSYYPNIWLNFVVIKIHLNNTKNVCTSVPYINKPVQLGRTCMKCNEFNQYAEDNQPNGGMICFSCRQNPYR
jgi:formylmethanofuran dehydrogenase subunit E